MSKPCYIISNMPRTPEPDNGSSKLSRFFAGEKGSRRDLGKAAVDAGRLAGEAALFGKTVVTAAAAGALEALAGCNNITTPKPETPGAEAIYRVLQTFSALENDQNVPDIDTAISLTAAAFKKGSTTEVVHDYSDISSHNGGFGDELHSLSNSLVGALASTAVMSGKTSEKVMNDYKSVYATIDNDFYSGGWGTSFSDENTLAVNGASMMNLPNASKDTVISTLKRLDNFTKTARATDNDVIKAQTGVIALGLLLQPILGQKSDLQGIMNAATEMNTDLSGTDASEAAMLALANVFATDPEKGSDTTKVKKLYNDFYQGDTSSQQAVILTLASVIDGYDSNRIKQMFAYAKKYETNSLPNGVDNNQAAQLTLATAMQESKLPTVVETQVASSINTLIPIIVAWWLLFR